MTQERVQAGMQESAQSDRYDFDRLERSVEFLIDEHTRLTGEREALLELDPAAFYVTDHYRAYPAMLVRLKEVRLDLLQELLEQAWRRQAPKRLVAEVTRDGVGQALTTQPRSVGRKVRRK